MRFLIVRPRMAAAAVAATAAALTFAAAAPATAATAGGGYSGDGRGETVTVMTRNIFLGADLGPALGATGTPEFIAANGAIFAQMQASNMPVRAKGLADEIRKRKPDLVGLQEAALWRTGPLDINAALEQQPVATEVYQDFLRLLLQRLNRKTKTYKAVVVANEFDFEAPADFDLDSSTGTLGADGNGRLTMRDVILIRRGAGIKVRKAKTGQFDPGISYSAKVGGVVDVTVVRGWARIDVKVRNSPWFRFGTVHLEAFDDRTERPSVRAQQAQAFADAIRKRQKRNGARMPLVALGDFNSDVPGLVPGDEQAFEAMLADGFTDIGTKEPLSCCIQNSYDLKTGGSRKDFDHRVDQIWTNTPRKVKPIKTWVTGRSKSYGYWHSDHAGVTAKLWVR